MARPKLIKPDMFVCDVANLAGVIPGQLGFHQFKNYRAACALIEAAGLSSGPGMRSRYDSEQFMNWYADNAYVRMGEVRTISGHKPVEATDFEELDDVVPPNEMHVVEGTVNNHMTTSTWVHKENTVSQPNDNAEQLASLIRNLASGAMDENKVRSLAREEIQSESENLIGQVLDLIAEANNGPKPTVVELAQSEAPNIPLGIQHKNFPDLLMACDCRDNEGNRLNVWLPGPAGTGKSRAAKEVAKALGLEFYFCGVLDSKYELSGFIDAGGSYHRTHFRNAYEKGGVMCLDEVDGSAPDVPIWLNPALANGHCAFPDAIVTRHPDCVIIATANTYGHGGTNDYVGRMKQDAAFMSRFVHIDWPNDDALEQAITPDQAWVEYVQSVRRRVRDHGIKVVISSRASLYGASLIAKGFSRERAAEMTLRQGMTASDWSIVK